MYKVPGTMNGTNYFDATNWEFGNHSGGSWEDWGILNGVLNVTTGGVAIDCALDTTTFEVDKLAVSPNPFNNYLLFESEVIGAIEIYDGLGKRIYFNDDFSGSRVDTSDFQSGLYFLKIVSDGVTTTKKIIKH